MDSKVLVIVSIYGPNNNDDNFFVDLRNVLHDNINFPVIIGGDWNLTPCTDPNDRNIDIINMRSPPSIHRSRLLAEFCEQFKLSDPFRALHPFQKDFTYIPRTGKNNRPHIDFF
jgi:exonuclease III